MKIKDTVNLTYLNTIRLTSCARCYLTLQKEEELVEISSYLKSKPSKFFILGGGSNILLPVFFDGLVIHNKLSGIKKADENKESVVVKVGAGVIWDEFVGYCVDNHWFGLENLSWIPGTVGASPVQNISAYGVEVREFIEAVEVFDMATEKCFLLNEKDCKFSYRHSIFKGNPGLIVTSVLFRLRKTPKLNLTYRDLAEYVMRKSLRDFSALNLRNLIIDIRRQKLPDHLLVPNIGSFFHNPIVTKSFAATFCSEYNIPAYETPSGMVKLSAGWLIENSGFKGYRDGNVGVYDKHALVLINTGSATQKELLDFAQRIKDKVYSKFNVALNIEPIVVT